MADIFVSYASEDLNRVKPLVSAFEDHGWKVWWDKELVAGPSFHDKIEEAIDKSRCIVVVWSRHSIKSQWVKTEANEGLERGILVPLLIEDVKPPLAFRISQTAKLFDWPKQEGQLGTVIAGISELLGEAVASSPVIDHQGKRSIAVLPFNNRSSDPEQEYFADGVTEDLIARLARHSSLRVIASTSSFFFKNRADDVRDIGKRLGVTQVRVLSRLFRRLFLERLTALHDQLQFFGEHRPLAELKIFHQYLNTVREIEWVVYAKRPFAGPEAVLAYLSQYTHRVAISNRRLLAYDHNNVTFKWKDYRLKGRKRDSTMTLPTDEFIRRFLIHILPTGFHRIRHFGLFANHQRRANLQQVRRLLGQAIIEPVITKAVDKPAPFICRTCGAPMIIIETLVRPQRSRAPPT